MKSILFFYLYASFIGNFANANDNFTFHCSGTIQFDGAYVDITCTNGMCSGQYPSQEITFNGVCDSNIDFEATGSITPLYVSGVCKNGILTSTFDSQIISLYGDCAKDGNYAGSFYGSIYTPIGYASGYCQTNGMSRLYFSGGSKPATGQCRTN